MINISGYITDADEEIEDKKNFIAINSCGYYKLVKLPCFQTSRPNGRSDFQLLYISKGAAHFSILGEMHIVPEGSVVIYLPHQPQYYIYNLSENPEIYWLHFSGVNIGNYMNTLGFKDSPWYNIGIKNEYISLFEKIIRELQVRREHFLELSNLYTLELLSLMSRNMYERGLDLPIMNEQIQNVIELIHKNSQSKQSINEYAKSCNMSTCWFIHSFKAYTGMTPQQYITDIRINKAKELLLYSSFNITEIASIVGYDNPFYFSRVFKKNTDLPPREYRNR
ncbi:MAG: helix-turn-helix domain-containing protein [Ruminiclostridium sp.]